MTEVFGTPTLEQVDDLCSRVLSEEQDSVIEAAARGLQLYAKFKRDPEFPPQIIWINGVEALERLPDAVQRMMKNSLNYNILFVFMGTSVFDNMSLINRCCDAVFLGGNNEEIFRRLNMNYTHRLPDSIALDLNIKSENEEHSFKKYKCSFARTGMPTIPFDELLG